jgi:alkanesulfonate monooxygenase SsuD/methylene tetrahydromethanopterin reductase-like flavin-dependent oxidoreductase (luciferase family)
MKFGLFYELQLPKPYDKDQWDEDAEYRLVQEALEQIEFADQLGFDYVFEVEHHFLEEYSHSSAPEVFLAAASQRTKRIRLGHGIVLMPPRYNHPARVAERIATLDLVSGGRVEFGTGESASDMELGGFGVPREEKKAMWEEATRECVKMMTMTPYPGYEGQYFGMPPRNVVPKPLQKPHPPLWVAASRKETVMVAARLGMGSLGFGFETPEELGQRVHEYYELIREECFPIGQAINPALAVLSVMGCAETDEEAIRGVDDCGSFFGFSLGYYYGGPPHNPGRVNLNRAFRDFPPEMQQTVGRRLGFAGYQGGTSPVEPQDEVARALWRAAQRGGCIGTPQFIRETLLQYERNHLDVMIFVMQAGNRKHSDIMRSLELFATKVMPEFKERHAEHQEWRRRQLEGVEFPINSSI